MCIKVLVLPMPQKKCKYEQQEMAACGVFEPLEKSAGGSEVVILAGSAGWY